MAAKSTKPIANKFSRSFICTYMFMSLLVLGCDSGNGSSESGVDYQDSWVLETPFEVTISQTVDIINGQTEIIKTVGEMTLYLDFADDGTIDLMADFFSIDPPICSSEAPCSMEGTFGTYMHQYMGNSITPEGLEASHVRIINDVDSNYADGYAYVSEGRLCISYGLWDFMIHTNENTGSDPLSIDFDRCLVRNT